MLRSLSLVWCLLCGTCLLNAQNNGLILDDEAYEQTPLVERSPDRGSGPPIVDLRPYCPRPGDQGNLPSCTAWSLANALTIIRARMQNMKNSEEIENARLSVSYIYNQIKGGGDCNAGASYSSGLNLLLQKGTCPARLLAYSLDCNPDPNSQHHTQALPNRIKGYRKVFELSDDPEEKINRLMDELARQRPVLIAIDVPPNFRNAIPAKDSPWLGQYPHAMVVVGYNDYAETFTLMNSYGSYWGEGGFFRMDFDTMGKWVKYAYILLI